VADDPQASLADGVLALAGLAANLGRDDLAERLRVAVARLTRPTTIICVVGEFKQGKSSLVNGLLGEVICPVDDDLATSALTLIRHGETSRVEVRRRVGEEVLVEASDVEHLDDWVCEAGNPGNGKGVERVDVVLPNDILARGVAIVDTPGMGSLGAGHAAATLAFLPFSDALVFVSDSSSELSAPEVDFLQRARELCPNVVFALTKTDIHPAWRRIAQLDEQHLATTGTPLPAFPLSSHLRMVAIDRRDRELNDASGFPSLFTEIGRRVVAPAKAIAATRAAAEATAAADQLETALQSELEVLVDPQRGAAVAAAATQAIARLEHLRGPGARWSVLVGDRITDLSNDATFRFRGAMRQITRDLEAGVEELKSGKDWDELARSLQTEVAEAVTAAFATIGTGAEALRADVVELLADDAAGLGALTLGAAPVDVRALWSNKSLDGKSSKSSEALGNTLAGLRGAQSGIVMFGMMARFLPAGIGALLATNPVTIGLGVAFGGLQILDVHKRKVAQRRQQARVQVRQFVDDVQFEVGNAMTEALRTVQRGMRDEFTERVTELQRTYTEAARQAEDAAKRTVGEAEQRAGEVRNALGALAAARLPIETVAAPA
jgi:hypothetical protein